MSGKAHCTRGGPAGQELGVGDMGLLKMGGTVTKVREAGGKPRGLSLVTWSGHEWFCTTVCNLSGRGGGAMLKVRLRLQGCGTKQLSPALLCPEGPCPAGLAAKVSGMLVASWLLITAEAAATGAACLQLSSRCVRLGVVMAEPLSETPVRFSPCLELLDDIPLAVMQIELGAVAADDGLPDVPVVF